MNKKIVFMALVLFIVGFFLLSGCSPSKPQVSQSEAKQVTVFLKIPLNSSGLTVEQNNEEKRIKVTTDPTKVLWIHLITLDGKIIRRMPVTSKVTSSNKRLEPVEAAVCWVGSGKHRHHSGYPKTPDGFCTTELIQPDGTFGPSDAYIFWFDPQGRYYQWGTIGMLGYLLTDFPIDLINPEDVATQTFNADKAAYEWQKLQEEQLKINEGK